MTQTIALVAAPYLLITALGFTISRGFYERMILGNANADPILLNLSGAAHFILGAIILVNHWDWSGLASALVTPLGIAAVAKGAALIAVPEMTLKSPKTVGAALTMSAVFFALWGCALLWVALT